MLSASPLPLMATASDCALCSVKPGGSSLDKSSGGVASSDCAPPVSAACTVNCENVGDCPARPAPAARPAAVAPVCAAGWAEAVVVTGCPGAPDWPFAGAPGAVTTE